MGSENSRSSRIGLGHPPFAESNPLRLSMSFIGAASRRHARLFGELATRKDSMSYSELLADRSRFIERISAIARTGLAFKPDGFDSERYEELLKEAARMHSIVANASADDAEVLRRQWREQVIAGYEGYVTAAVGCGGIAFIDRDEILM